MSLQEFESVKGEVIEYPLSPASPATAQPVFQDGRNPFTEPIGGVDPVDGADLATRDFVEASQLTAGSGAPHAPAGSGAITLNQTHLVVLVDASGAARSVNLPAAVDSLAKQYYIKKIDAAANAVTIDPDGAELIDGAATAVLTAQYDSLHIYCDGAGWHIL
jgi:hypothetical protein